MYVALDAAKYGRWTTRRPVRAHSKLRVARRPPVPRAERLRDRHAHARAFRARARPARQLELRRPPAARWRRTPSRRPTRTTRRRSEALLFGYFDGRRGAGLHTASRTTSSCTRRRTRSSTVCGRATWSRRARTRRRSTRASPTSSRCCRSSRSPRWSTYAFDSAVGRRTRPTDAAVAELTVDALKHGDAARARREQFGEEFSGVHGAALRRSVTLEAVPTSQPRTNFEERTGAARCSSPRCCTRSSASAARVS